MLALHVPTRHTGPTVLSGWANSTTISYPVADAGTYSTESELIAIGDDEAAVQD